MCTSPSFVWVKRGPEWVKVPAPCDLCWSCRENYVSDWVGRCLCEAATCETTVTLSLTYANPGNPQDFSHRIVNPHHFQLGIKRLRNAGHKIRYLVAGEYGELKDRAHFHAILFFKSLKNREDAFPKLENRKAFAENPEIAAPLSRQMPQQEMCHIREWPHGHVVADWSCTEKSIRYVCEYINPKNGNKKNGWFQPSKKPPLGWEWFAEKAMRNIEYGVMPSTFEYMPPGGKPGKKYLMTGATRRDYLNLIVRDRAKRPFMSPWVKATFDKLERQEFVKSRDAASFDDEAFLARQPSVDKVRSAMVWQDGLDKTLAERVGAYVAKEWGFDDVEEFEAFAAAGGIETHPEYFVGGTEYFPSSPRGAGDAERSAVDAGSADRSAKRAPTGYDRQGNPYWGEPGREYLAAAFERKKSGGETGGDVGSE